MHRLYRYPPDSYYWYSVPERYLYLPIIYTFGTVSLPPFSSQAFALRSLTSLVFQQTSTVAAFLSPCYPPRTSKAYSITQTHFLGLVIGTNRHRQHSIRSLILLAYSLSSLPYNSAFAVYLDLPFTSRTTFFTLAVFCSTIQRWHL